jgi:hypothetical protein
MERPSEDREKFLREAGELYDELMARTGPASGDTFDDIEMQASKGGKALILKLIRDRMKSEEEVRTGKVLCPKCGRPMRRPKDPSSRNLDTPSGTVGYARRHAICDHCGVSFSPSGSSTEDSSSRPIQSPPADGL